MQTAGIVLQPASASQTDTPQGFLHRQVQHQDPEPTALTQRIRAGVLTHLTVDLEFINPFIFIWDLELSGEKSPLRVPTNKESFPFFLITESLQNQKQDDHKFLKYAGTSFPRSTQL